MQVLQILATRVLGPGSTVPSAVRGEVFGDAALSQLVELAAVVPQVCCLCSRLTAHISDALSVCSHFTVCLMCCLFLFHIMYDALPVCSHFKECFMQLKL